MGSTRQLQIRFKSRRETLPGLERVKECEPA
jgi:hypothetical protein